MALLEQEMTTYKAALPGLKAQEGRYVLIHGSDVVETFAAYSDAIKAGYTRFGSAPLLVKQIRAVERVQSITRHLDTPCCT